MVEDTQRVKELRRSLEDWREILIFLYSVLIWEKQFFAGVVASVVTFGYLLIWYIDPAVLTFISFFGIIVTLCDYFVPQVIPLVCGANQWTGAQERKYDQVVATLAGFQDSVAWFFSSLHSMKTMKPKTFFIVVVVSLLICAWIGSSVNNLFLTYLIVLVMTLFPGLRRQEPVKKWLATATDKFSGLLKGESSSSDQKGLKKE